MGEKQRKLFQLGFNGFLKSFLRIASNVGDGLILVRKLDERLVYKFSISPTLGVFGLGSSNLFPPPLSVIGTMGGRFLHTRQIRYQ